MLSPKMLNSSLKSEFTNIFTLDDERMNYKFPCRSKFIAVSLSLPEFQVKRPVKFLNFTFSLCKSGSHVRFLSAFSI